MQHEPSIGTFPEDAEYDFQELRAQQQRAKLLFHCYVVDDVPDSDDEYYAYYGDTDGDDDDGIPS
jgi:hypothetical protein